MKNIKKEQENTLTENKFATISVIVYRRFISNIICRILTKSEKLDKYLRNYFASNFLIQILEITKRYEIANEKKIKTSRSFIPNVKILYNKYYKYEKVEVFEILKKFYILQNQNK